VHVCKRTCNKRNKLSTKKPEVSFLKSVQGKNLELSRNLLGHRLQVARLSVHRLENTFKELPPDFVWPHQERCLTFGCIGVSGSRGPVSCRRWRQPRGPPADWRGGTGWRFRERDVVLGGDARPEPTVHAQAALVGLVTLELHGLRLSKVRFFFPFSLRSFRTKTFRTKTRGVLRCRRLPIEWPSLNSDGAIYFPVCSANTSPPPLSPKTRRDECAGVGGTGGAWRATPTRPPTHPPPSLAKTRHDALCPMRWLRSRAPIRKILRKRILLINKCVRIEIVKEKERERKS
jgi:hypothetical protein